MNHVACEIVFIHPGHRTSRVPALPRNVDEGEPTDLIGFRPRLVTRRTPPFRNYLTLVSRRCLSIFPSPASKTLSSKRNALSFSHPRIPSSGEREGGEKKRAETRRINVYKYTAEERFAKPTVATLVGGEGAPRARDAEFPKGRQRSPRERPLYPIN